jgi:hypothetical protein
MYEYIKKGFRKWCGKKPELCENTKLEDLTSEQIKEIFGDISLNQEIKNEPMGVRVREVPNYTLEEIERMKKIKQRQLQYEEEQRRWLVQQREEQMTRERRAQYEQEIEEARQIDKQRQKYNPRYPFKGQKSRRPRTRKACKSRKMKWNSSTKRCNKSKK